MATLQQIEQALIKADAAGNVDDAKALAGELRLMREAPELARAPAADVPAAPPAEAAPEPEMQDRGGALQTLGNLAAGAVRGAGSIGATLMTPVDAAARAVGIENDFIGRRDRREAMDGGLQELGAETDSLSYQGGKLAAEVAGTAGVGGALARSAAALPAALRVAPTLVRAVETGGLSAGGGNLAVRTVGGAITGGASAGLIDPDAAADGAMLGAALPAGVKVAAKVGQGIQGAAKQFLGATTGTSAETVGAAYQAGRNGSKSFLQNMRGGGDFGDVVDVAKEGLERMRAARGAHYRGGMVDIANDKAVLDFAPIDAAVSSVQKLGSYKGVQTNKHASGIVDELAEKVAEWKALDPTEYHTPEGLDALKRAVGDIRDATQFGTPGRRAADSVYNAVKGEIAKQAPTYERVMADYAHASQNLDEITRALSLGDKASKDTAIRKLQSLMRNNAQTNYGNRLSLASQLEKQGGVELIDPIAGQSLNTWMPRGMSGALTKVGTTGAGAAAAVGAISPNVLALAPLASPRLMGEAAYAAGRLASAPANVASQLGARLPHQQLTRVGEGVRVALPMAILANQEARQ